jgi:pimeloyl-ACP methyl ester carboxylesterase
VTPHSFRRWCALAGSLIVGVTSSWGSAAAAPRTTGIVRTPTQLAHTSDGLVGFREVGSGSPLLLITGFGATMDNWAPSFVNDLARQHRVIVFDNAGVGSTTALGSPLTIDAMADQTSALLNALGVRRCAVLGWSMGGMIAQALAVDDPKLVTKLVLASTQAGTGKALPVSLAATSALNSSDPAMVLRVLFPSNRSSAERAYVKGITLYPGFYGASSAAKSEQDGAIAQWFAGADPLGLRGKSIRAPTLVADGTEDALDPTSNDRQLVRLIRRASISLYPGAGHAFLFQDARRFVARVNSFLG